MIRWKEEADRLDREVKRAHARISDLERQIASMMTLGPSARVKHTTFGGGRIVAISRGVAMVDWDNGKTAAIDLVELRHAGSGQ